MPGFRHPAFPDRSAPFDSDTPGASRFSRMEFPDMYEVSDSAEPRRTRDKRPSWIGIPHQRTAWASRTERSRSYIPCLSVPLSTLRRLCCHYQRRPGGQTSSLHLVCTKLFLLLLDAGSHLRTHCRAVNPLSAAVPCKPHLRGGLPALPGNVPASVSPHHPR